MTKEQEKAIEILEKIDVKFFISGMTEQKDYIIDKADEVNVAIETVLSMLEEKDKQIEQYQNILATNDMLHVIECENKDKIIGLYIDNIMTHQQVKTIRRMCCPTCQIGEACTYSGIHRNCIKRYFENKADGGNER